MSKSFSNCYARHPYQDGTRVTVRPWYWENKKEQEGTIKSSHFEEDGIWTYTVVMDDGTEEFRSCRTIEPVSEKTEPESRETIRQRLVDPPMCECARCTALLNQGAEGIIEIWQGSGANGKTTLLNFLTEKYGEINVARVSADVNPKRWKDLITENIRLVRIQESEKNYDYVAELIDILRENPQMRCVFTTNRIYPWMHKSHCRLIEFRHTFVNTPSGEK